MAEAILRWLVGYDFSDCAEAAAELAARDLEAQGGTLILLHAYRMVSNPAPADVLLNSAALSSWSDVQGALVTAINERMEIRAQALRERHPALKVEVLLVEGFGEHAILDAAKAHKVDRIIVGTHGRKGLKHLVLGSVAERVTRMAEVPVLVVKAKSK